MTTNNGNNQKIYLPDRGEKCSFATAFGGPKFRNKQYNAKLLQYDIFEGEWEQVLEKADKRGCAVRRCRWILSIFGAVLFIAGLMGFQALVTMHGNEVSAGLGGLAMDAMICDAGVGSNQCDEKTTTECCNFWCCGGHPTEEEKKITGEGRQQKPRSDDLENKIKDGHCFYIKAIEKLTADGRVGYPYDGFCNGVGHWTVEGSTYHRVPEKQWSLDIAFYVPFVLAFVWVAAIQLLYWACKCYRKAVIPVFEKGFAKGRVGVSWQNGQMGQPNMVILHLQQQNNFQKPVSIGGVRSVAQQQPVVVVPQQRTVIVAQQPVVIVGNAKVTPTV